MVLPRPISVPPLRFGVLQGGVLMLCVALLLVGCGRKIREIIKKYRKSQPRLTASSTSEAQCTNQRALMACEYVGGYLVSLIRVERRTGSPVRGFDTPSMTIDLRAGDHFALYDLQTARDRKAEMAAGRIVLFADAPESGRRKFSLDNSLGFAGWEGLFACLAQGRIGRVASAVCTII